MIGLQVACLPGTAGRLSPGTVTGALLLEIVSEPSGHGHPGPRATGAAGQPAGRA